MGAVHERREERAVELMPDSRLYAWQAEALEAWTRAGRAGIIEAVTGTGKTRVGQTAIEEALNSGQRAVVRRSPGRGRRRQARHPPQRPIASAVARPTVRSCPETYITDSGAP